MGSSSADEEERFVQMVRDFIESEPTPVIPLNNSSIPLHQNPSFLSLQVWLPFCQFNFFPIFIDESLNFVGIFHGSDFYFVIILILCYVYQKMLEEVSADETEVLEKILLYLKDMGKTKNIKEFIVLKLKMEGYEASLCKNSWISDFDRPSGLCFTLFCSFFLIHDLGFNVILSI